MEYSIPLFNLNFDEEEEKSALDTIKSHWISSGPKCIELEKIFSEMIGSQYSLTVSSCTAALHLALLCAGIKPGDEVILPSLTFVATANAVRYVGAIPVFADIISAEKCVIDPKQIEELITSKTKAVIIMHYAGFPCDMDVIVQITRKYNLKLIEDACHGPMSEYKGKKVGTFGDLGCFSFFSNKNISTGEGGILVTDNEEIFKKAKLLRSHGMTTMSYERSKGHSTNYDVVELGYNYRLDDIRAAIGIAQVNKLLSDIKKREYVRENYLKQLGEDKRIVIPFFDSIELSSSYIFPIVIREGNSKKRDKIREYLARRGIQTSIHYTPVHRFKIYQEFIKKSLPITEYVADCEITLPMYGMLNKDKIDYISDMLKNALDEIL